MHQTECKRALKAAYSAFHPHSKKYQIDFERYLLTLSTVASIPGIADKRVLDICTGIGIMPVGLQKLGIKANGLDKYIFPDAKNEMFGLSHIDELRSVWKKENVNVYPEDILGEKLPEGVFPVDVIVSEAAIEHMKDPRRFLQKCFSLLSGGGYFLVTTPNVAALLKRLRFLIGKPPNWPIEEFFRDGEGFTGHWREYTLRELVYMCQAVGFQVVQGRSVNNLARIRIRSSFKKNLWALISRLGSFVPNGGEMLYVLCRKP